MRQTDLHLRGSAPLPALILLVPTSTKPSMPSPFPFVDEARSPGKLMGHVVRTMSPQGPSPKGRASEARESCQDEAILCPSEGSRSEGELERALHRALGCDSGWQRGCEVSACQRPARSVAVVHAVYTSLYNPAWFE